jgi:hypothetical protein
MTVEAAQVELAEKAADIKAANEDKTAIKTQQAFAARQPRGRPRRRAHMKGNGDRGADSDDPDGDDDDDEKRLTPDEVRRQELLAFDDLRFFGIRYSRTHLYRLIKAGAFLARVEPQLL